MPHFCHISYTTLAIAVLWGIWVMRSNSTHHNNCRNESENSTMSLVPVHPTRTPYHKPYFLCRVAPPHRVDTLHPPSLMQVKSILLDNSLPQTLRVTLTYIEEKTPQWMQRLSVRPRRNQKNYFSLSSPSPAKTAPSFNMRHLARVAASHTGTAALRAGGQLSRLDPAMALYRAPFGERLPRASRRKI